MKPFQDALLCHHKSNLIPEKYDYFGMLVGEWNFEWNDRNNPRIVQGEWIFSWILEGTAIQDVFICPSRTTRLNNPQPDGEYGTTLRVYNPHTTAWDVSYICIGHIDRLEAKKEASKIVLTKIDKNEEKWVFSDITATTFHWQNVTVLDDDTWHINADIYATRK